MADDLEHPLALRVYRFVFNHPAGCQTKTQGNVMGLSPAKGTSSLGAWQKRSFRHLLHETRTFVTCAELVTSRGIITERSGRRVLELARELAHHPRIHALSITDNPGGNA